MMDNNTRLLLVDDHRIVLEGLRSLLQAQPDLQVVDVATNGRQALEKVGELMPDMVITDVTMPDLNGVDAAKQIKSSWPEVLVIGLSVHESLHYVSEMMKAGASGYLLKQCAFEELTLCIRTVKAGNFYLSPVLSQSLIRERLRELTTDQDNAFSLLSSREREVLQLLAEGASIKRAAEVLHLSGKTIETHRQNIMRKIDAHNIADLVKYAIRQGVTPV